MLWLIQLNYFKHCSMSSDSELYKTPLCIDKRSDHFIDFHHRFCVECLNFFNDNCKSTRKFTFLNINCMIRRMCCRNISFWNIKIRRLLLKLIKTILTVPFSWSSPVWKYTSSKNLLCTSVKPMPNLKYESK